MYDICVISKKLIFIWLLFIMLSVFVLLSTPHQPSVLVILYETDLSNEHLRTYLDTLQRFNYNYIILTDTQWKGFGRKVKTIEHYLHTLHPEQIVVISDARDVFVCKKANTLYDTYASLAKDKILVSTELACCEHTRRTRPPNSFRKLDGSHLPTNEISTDSGAIQKWIDEYKKLADSKYPNKNLKFTNPNAGLYMGKAKHLLNMYSYMNIKDDKEDDQSVLSEIILQHPHLFVLDYFSAVFSNSFAWNQNAPEIYDGCYYTKDKSARHIQNLIFKTKPFFLHFPAKHFSCYDKVLEMLNKTNLV